MVFGRSIVNKATRRRSVLDCSYKSNVEDERDLFRAPTLATFLSLYAAFIEASAAVLAPGGRIAILMGDYCDRKAGFIPLVYHTKRLAFEAGLRQCCSDIIRFSHGASSSRKVYQTSSSRGCTKCA